MLNRPQLCCLCSCRMSASHDGSVRIWSKRTLLCMKTLRIHWKHIHTMAFDGSNVYTGGSDK